jgi:5-methylcytosine-specific restriction endonuclease McrA
MFRNKEKHNAYHKVYQLERYHRRRQQAIDKLGGKCVVCGDTEDLEIDHIDYKEKKFNVARLWSAKEELFWTEINKCQLLCKKHHIEKTVEEIGIRRPLTHGKRWAAINHKCQCADCIQFKKEYRKSQSQKKRDNLKLKKI